MEAVRRCVTCKEHKARSEFATATAQRCGPCAEPTPCVVCNIPCDNRYQTCRSAECLHVARSNAAQTGNALRAAYWERKRAARTTRTCSACDRNFPLTTEFFSPARRDAETQEVVDLAYYCKPCARIYQRVLYAASEARRKKVYGACGRRRAEDRLRRANDPEFATEQRRRWAEWRRGEHTREVTDLGAPREYVRLLDARPFLEWIENTRPQYGSKEFFCEVTGISEKNLRRLERGEQAHVQLDTVDAALTREGSADLRDLYPALYDDELVAA